jgi:diguanylate cyclase (GGDEF)-like protein
MAQEIEKMRRLSLLDALTEIGNRRFAEGQLQGIVNEASRFSWLSGILLADIDKFKVVNDTYGHGAGDHTLQVVAQALRHGVRSFDHVCRWGGEEFLGIIRHVDATNLKLVAEKLRMLVEASAIPATPAAIHVTVSIGGTLIRNDDTTESVVKRADELMYASKSRGRNCVSIG